MDYDKKQGPKATARPGTGLSPSFFPGQHYPERTEYSLAAKLFGFLIVICIILFMVWAYYSMAGF